jgi:hypothetical protein
MFSTPVTREPRYRSLHQIWHAVPLVYYLDVWLVFCHCACFVLAVHIENVLAPGLPDNSEPSTPGNTIGGRTANTVCCNALDD